MSTRVLWALIVLSTIVLLLPANAVSGATFTVTKTADTADGVCDGDCSLREAVIAANATAGPDSVNIPAGIYQVSIPGTAEDGAATGDIDINDDVTITGAGAANTVVQAVGGQDGYGTDRIFQIRFGSSSVSGLTLTKGHLESGPGAGVAVDRGASLSMRDSVIGDNKSGTDGGGIDNRGSLFLKNVSLLSNDSGGSGGGLSNPAADSATLENVTIRGNRGYYGGGIYNTNNELSAVNLEVAENVGTGSGGGIANFLGTVHLTRVVTNSNHADGGGGGISNHSGTISVTDGVISGNSANFSAGGIANFPSGTDPARAQLTLTRVTISNNSAGGEGGGMFNLREDASLGNVTISSNNAATGAGILNTATATVAINATTFASNPAGGGSGVKNDDTSTLTLSNTILAGTAGSDNCEGLISSEGHNLDSGSGCGLSGNGDLTMSDPLIGPLENNGGTTYTHELLPGSPAIDAGDNTKCPATDQRGANRPIGVACDIGAYEFGDTDADTWSDAAENAMGTNPAAACGADAWPPDINNNGFSDISDVVLLVNYFGQPVPPAPQRYDLAPDPPAAPGGRFIDISDITRMVNYFGMSCAA